MSHLCFSSEDSSLSSSMQISRSGATRGLRSLSLHLLYSIALDCGWGMTLDCGCWRVVITPVVMAGWEATAGFVWNWNVGLLFESRYAVEDTLPFVKTLEISVSPSSEGGAPRGAWEWIVAGSWRLSTDCDDCSCSIARMYCYNGRSKVGSQHCR